MTNKRMNQLVFMLSKITGKSDEELESIIESTNEGKAILANNPAVLYEQQTENLYSIALELHQNEKYEDVANMLTKQAIVEAMKQLEEMENHTVEKVPLCYQSNRVQKDKIKQQDKSNMKNMLQIKQQNKINVGRM